MESKMALAGEGTNERIPVYSAHCSHEGCRWQSLFHADSTKAQGALERHTAAKHPEVSGHSIGGSTVTYEQLALDAERRAEESKTEGGREFWLRRASFYWLRAPVEVTTQVRQINLEAFGND